MALTRDESDPGPRISSALPLTDPSLCTYVGPNAGPVRLGTLTNRSADTIGRDGRAKIVSDPLADALLDGGRAPSGFDVSPALAMAIRASVRESISTGAYYMMRADARLGTTCDYWFVVVPSPRLTNPRTGREFVSRPWAFTLNSLVTRGFIEIDTAENVYRYQRTAEERATDAASMDRTAREADRHDAEFEARRPGLWDYFASSVDDLLDSVPTALLVGAGAIAALLLVRR